MYAQIFSYKVIRQNVPGGLIFVSYLASILKQVLYDDNDDGLELFIEIIEFIYCSLHNG